MKTTISIIETKRGWALKVDGCYINWDLEKRIKAIKEDYMPYGATEWVSINALRNFWHKYMPMIIASIKRPYRSFNGSLIPVNK